MGSLGEILLSSLLLTNLLDSLHGKKDSNILTHKTFLFASSYQPIALRLLPTFTKSQAAATIQNPTHHVFVPSLLLPNHFHAHRYATKAGLLPEPSPRSLQPHVRVTTRGGRQRDDLGRRLVRPVRHVQQLRGQRQRIRLGVLRTPKRRSVRVHERSGRERI